MPLTLITGPANAAKAGAVLERLKAVLAREPVLVVPTAADAAHYQRELAAAGVVFGAEVLTFSALVRELGRLTGVRGRGLGPVARERVMRTVVAETPLAALAASARAPGFATALGALFTELQRTLVSAGRFASAVRAWEAVGEAPPHARELAALYSAYHARLEALGVTDAEGRTRAALDGLRARPGAWPGRPLFLYGFDELTAAQLDATEALVRLAEADVCVALPYEPGRAALAGSAATVELLKPLAQEHVQLDARSEHYAPAARGALHHLERALFEPEPRRVPPNGAVRLLEAGGERAEAELVGAAVLELLRDGMAPEDVAVLARGGAARAALAQVFDEYGIPVARDRLAPLSRTRLGAGLLGCARAALGTGTAADLVSWLRTPGKLAAPDTADALEAAVRRSEATSAAEARRLWERTLGQRELQELDAIAEAAEEGAQPFLAALLAEAAATWTAPHRRLAAVLEPEAEADARAAAELRSATNELAALAKADPALAGGPAELLEVLAAVRVREGHGAAEGAPGVLLADPLSIRARRFRAVVVCGLQEGELPRNPVPEPFLDDAARASLAKASGLVLARHESELARERSLFYACVSRPEEALLLSFRSSDEEGEPLQPSPFVADVRALFTDELWTGRGRRLLADVTWRPSEAPTPQELRRAQAAGAAQPPPPPLAPPEAPAARELLARRDREAARGLETFTACGVKWLVEHVLRPAPLEPDPEPLRRGALAHRVLERTLALLRERTGSARLTAGSLDAALTALRDALGELRAPPGVRGAAAMRGLAVDLERYLRHEAECGAGFEPALLEWSFGGEGEPGALMVDGVAVSGRVDRIDVESPAPADPSAPGEIAAGRRAIVRDYKGRNVTAGARWAEDGRLQAALYALAVRERLGLEVAGALYQPLGGRERRPRGLVRDDVPGSYVNGDRVDAAKFEEGLEAARAAAAEAARALRAGRIAPCPERCSPQGCAHPGICRA